MQKIKHIKIKFSLKTLLSTVFYEFELCFQTHFSDSKTNSQTKDLLKCVNIRFICYNYKYIKYS